MVEVLKITSLWPNPAPSVDGRTFAGPKSWVEFAWAGMDEAAPTKHATATMMRRKAPHFIALSPLTAIRSRTITVTAQRHRAGTVRMNNA
jgi:hypothetical protein